MNDSEARQRFAGARAVRLATAGADGVPHLVVITFAVVGQNTIVSAVDHKPKRTERLKRLANIAANPAVSLLADHYAEDWSQLWWARADGRARVLLPGAEPDLRAEAAAALVERYPPYRDRVPSGPLIVVDVIRWSGWRA